MRFEKQYGPEHRAEITDSLQRLTFAPASGVSAATAALLDEFDAVMSNGGGRCGSIRVEHLAQPVARWLVDHPAGDDLLAAFARRAVFNDAARVVLPEVYEGVPPGTGPSGFDYTEPLDFSHVRPLHLEGDIAETLHQGGAYPAPVATPATRATHLAAGFCADVVHDDYEHVSVVVTADPWCDWFHGVVWDTTWIITDIPRSLITILCVTDGD